jgi:ribosomal protein L19
MSIKKNVFYIKERKNRTRILGNLVKFTRGDILTINYRLFGLGFIFTGLCIKVSKKSMMNSNTAFCLRNVFGKVSVEVNFNLYSLCRVSYKLLDYARKKVYYKSSKLYYLRTKPNKESWVKSY